MAEEIRHGIGDSGKPFASQFREDVAGGLGQEERFDRFRGKPLRLAWAASEGGGEAVLGEGFVDGRAAFGAEPEAGTEDQKSGTAVDRASEQSSGAGGNGR